jgi:hypothetical protein
VFFITKKYFSIKMANLFLILCATNPFLVLFDSLALQEPSLTLLSTILFSLTLSMIQVPALFTGIAIGLTAGVGVWVKPNIVIFLPGLLVGMYRTWVTHHKHMKKIILTICGIFGSFLFLFLPLRFHPLFQIIEKKTAERAFSVPELLSFPIHTWLPHISSSLEWFIGYGTIPVILLSLYGIIQSLQMKKNRFFILWFLLPIMVTLLTAKMLTARYIIYTMPIFIFFTSFGIMKMTRYRIPVTVATLIISITTSTLLMISPLSYYRFLRFFPQTHTDFAQYVSGWPSGYGIKEAILFLEKKAIVSPIVITVRLDSGNPEDAVYLYGERIRNTIVGPQNDLPAIYDQMKTLGISYPVYFVSRGDQHGLFKSCLEESKKFTKPLDPEYVGVYEIDRMCAERLIEKAVKK